jgi:hypothetical protein
MKHVTSGLDDAAAPAVRGSKRQDIWLLSIIVVLATAVFGWLVILPEWSAYRDGRALTEALRLEALAETQDTADDRDAGLKAALSHFEALEKQSSLPDAQKRLVAQHAERLRILEPRATLVAVQNAINAEDPVEADRLLNSLSSYVNPRQNSNIYWPFRNAIQPLLVADGDVLLDLKNGMSIPTGETLEKFQGRHPGANCFDFEGNKMCELTSAAPTDCPGRVICTGVTYIFTDGILDGVNANYDADTWATLFTSSTEKFGPPDVSAVPTTDTIRMSSEKNVWKLPNGYLSLLKFSGTNFRGDPIAHPFSAIYGSTDPRPPKETNAAEPGIFQYDQEGLKLTADARQDGLAVIVKNTTGGDLTISPSAIQVKTEIDSWRPFTLFDMSLLGIGVPGGSIVVKAGDTLNMVANGFCGANAGCGGDPSRGRAQIEGKIVGVNILGHDLNPGQQ